VSVEVAGVSSASPLPSPSVNWLGWIKMFFFKKEHVFKSLFKSKSQYFKNLQILRILKQYRQHNEANKINAQDPKAK